MRQDSVRCSGPAYLGRPALGEHLDDPQLNVGIVSSRKTLGIRILRWFNGLGSESTLQHISDKAYYRKSEVPDF